MLKVIRTILRQLPNHQAGSRLRSKVGTGRASNSQHQFAICSPQGHQPGRDYFEATPQKLCPPFEVRLGKPLVSTVLVGLILAKYRMWWLTVACRLRCLHIGRRSFEFFLRSWLVHIRYVPLSSFVSLAAARS